VRFDGGDVIVTTLDPATIESLVDLDVRQGSVRDLRADQVAVSAGYAEDHRLTLGDAVTVGYGAGVTERPRVGAVYGKGTVIASGGIVLTGWGARGPTQGRLSRPRRGRGGRPGLRG
jgi:putative ABC transport system permease protein